MNPSQRYDARGFGIPAYMVDQLCGYVFDHKEVGDFLYYIITNDLRNAVMSADDTNVQLVPKYVQYLYNRAPVTCWGSKEVYEKWLVK